MVHCPVNAAKILARMETRRFTLNNLRSLLRLQTVLASHLFSDSCLFFWFRVPGKIPRGI